MKLLRLFLISLIVISFIPKVASADDGNTLYCYSKSSMTPMIFSLDELEKITFSNDGIQMWTQNQMDEIMFEDFLLFTFTEIEHPYLTSLETPFSSKDIHIRYLANQRMLFIESGVPLSSVCVYDIQGRIVTNNKSEAKNYNITLSAIPAGVYLVEVICNGKLFIKKFVL